jgi:hypothetical protein
MSNTSKPNASDPKKLLQNSGDPLVNYIEYVLPEARERNPLSAYFLQMAVEALREKQVNGAAELH